MTVRWMLCLMLVVSCADLAGPFPGRPVHLEYCGYDETPCEEPSPPPWPPVCTPPLVLWTWEENINGVVTTGWFCAAPPWW